MPKTFAILCPTATGHLNPMMALGREIKRRGHRVIFYQPPDGQHVVESNGFEFSLCAEKEFPLGSIPALYQTLGKMSGLNALRFTVELIKRRTDLALRELPTLLRRDGVEPLIADQIAIESGTIANDVDIPYVTVSNAVVLNQESAVPPFFTHWTYNRSTWARVRNQSTYTLFNRISRSLLEIVNEFRRKKNWNLYRVVDESISPLAQLSQQIASLDFPRANLPSTFHYLGPFHDDTAPTPPAFPFDRLNGLPLVYASMGTLQNQQQKIFHHIAEASAHLPVQLVLSLGGGSQPSDFPKLPGEPIVVSYAPQIDLLKRAKICITHGGMNTALESLAHGVPMVVMPVTNDQPGVAARIAWSGSGQMLSLRSLTSNRLKGTLQKILHDPTFNQNARRIQKDIRQAGRIRGAVDVVERVMASA